MTHRNVSNFLSSRGNGGNGPPSRLPAAWVALVEIIARVHREPYHWPVGRTTFQKIAYFATELGLPTGLKYERGSYGPFAAEVKPLLTKLVNHGLLREHQMGRMFALEPGPTYHDAVTSFGKELGAWESLIERVSDLFLRMRTDDAEIAATVFFTARRLQQSRGGKPSEGDVFNAVKQWKLKRRPPLRDEDVARSIRTLNLLRWLDLEVTSDLPLPEEFLVEA